MAEQELLQPPGDEVYPVLNRRPSHYNPLRSFMLSLDGQKHYKQQYGDMYFLRLAKLKPAVEQAAREAWDDFEVSGERVLHKDRVLDVRQGELCWVAGTIYIEMPLKPNVLQDILQDNWISVGNSKDKYISPDGQDQVMLEDESGRLRLVGVPLETTTLVTGCIIAVMGTENANGEFDVLDIRIPDLPRQPQRWERDDGESVLQNGKTGKRKRPEDPDRTPGSQIAIISGLGISGDHGEGLKLELLMEYLLGELGGLANREEASRITRLVIAGNSLADASHSLIKEEAGTRKVAKKYGYDASAYNPHPTAGLDRFIATLLPSLPITLIPGEADPANVSLPQQPIHSAILPHCRPYTSLPKSGQTGWLDSVTNPWDGDIDGWRFMGNGGQPLNDVYKYVEGDDRLGMMENILRWRCGAPTAPDTLWCYPFQDRDPFVIEETPHVFFVGNQPAFETEIIEGPLEQAVRLIMVPKFHETGEFVLLDMDTLGAEVVRIDILETQ